MALEVLTMFDHLYALPGVFVQDHVFFVVAADPGRYVDFRRVMFFRCVDDPPRRNQVELGLCMDILKRFLLTVVLDLTLRLSIEDR